MTSNKFQPPVEKMFERVYQTAYY